MASTFINQVLQIHDLPSLLERLFFLSLSTLSLAAGFGFLFRRRWGHMAIRLLAPVIVVLTAPVLFNFFTSPSGEMPELARFVAMLMGCYLVISLYTAIVSWIVRLPSRTMPNQ